jgi:DNA-binding LacI/PurR family transcriptional regulator
MEEHRTTLKDIAAVVGVSARAVSAALNGTGRISQEMRERIQEVARQMHYRPNLQARGLVQQRTYLLGTVFPYANVSFFNDIISGIEERCTQAGYDMLLGNANLLHEKDEERALSRMIHRGVDGIICAPDYREIDLFKQIEQHGPPTIQVMTRIDQSGLPFVGVDNVFGGYLATKHLLDLGHSKIGFLASSRVHYSEIEDRYAGFLRALVEQGIQLDVSSFTVKSELTVEGGYVATNRLLDQNHDITAIFASTDYAAVGSLRAILERGLRVPADISVIGYDNLSIAEHQSLHPLTTIAQPKREIGIKAFDMLEAVLAGHAQEDIIMKPSLKVRSTTGLAKLR